MQKKSVEIAVIGGGPAGLGAAHAAWEAGARDILILERDFELGGILNQCIHPGFGLQIFEKDWTGPEYAEYYIDRVQETGIECSLNTMVLEVTEDRHIYAISSSQGFMDLEAQVIIYAMGCRERPRGDIPGTRPAGIFTAGTAQRLTNVEGYIPGKDIIMLGSGDIGLIMARRMHLEGANMKAVLARRPYASGLRRNVAQCLEDYDIPLLLQHAITHIHGEDRVEGITMCRTDDRAQPILDTAEFVPCDTVLLSLGLVPETELCRTARVDLDPATNNGPVVDEYMMTNVPGIFACGNVAHVHDVVDWVTMEAQLAGKGAVKYLRGEKHPLPENPVTFSPGRNVGYVVPHHVNPEISEPVLVCFRVRNIERNVKVKLTAGDEVLRDKRYRIVLPSEMVRIELEPEVINRLGPGAEIQVSVEEVG